MSFSDALNKIDFSAVKAEWGIQITSWLNNPPAFFSQFKTNLAFIGERLANFLRDKNWVIGETDWSQAYEAAFSSTEVGIKEYIQGCHAMMITCDVIFPEVWIYRVYSINPRIAWQSSILFPAMSTVLAFAQFRYSFPSEVRSYVDSLASIPYLPLCYATLQMNYLNKEDYLKSGTFTWRNLVSSLKRDRTFISNFSAKFGVQIKTVSEYVNAMIFDRFLSQLKELVTLNPTTVEVLLSIEVPVFDQLMFTDEKAAPTQEKVVPVQAKTKGKLTLVSFKDGVPKAFKEAPIQAPIARTPPKFPSDKSIPQSYDPNLNEKLDAIFGPKKTTKAPASGDPNLKDKIDAIFGHEKLEAKTDKRQPLKTDAVPAPDKFPLEDTLADTGGSIPNREKLAAFFGVPLKKTEQLDPAMLVAAQGELVGGVV